MGLLFDRVPRGNLWHLLLLLYGLACLFSALRIWTSIPLAQNIQISRQQELGASAKRVDWADTPLNFSYLISIDWMG
jgi:hypothetical protein